MFGYMMPDILSKYELLTPSGSENMKETVFGDVYTCSAWSWLEENQNGW
jgi:hypothetical protein